MGTFEDLEREISEQNAALESLLAELENEEIANEALFKEKVTVDDLLEKVKAAADKCKSSEDCEKLLEKLKEEEDKFNKCFKDMKDAAEKFKDGKIEKDELNEVVVAAMKEIKKSCDLLAVRDVDENLDDVKDSEIEMLRDFLVKSREVIEEKCESFGECDSDDDEDEIDEEEDEKDSDDDKEEEKEEKEEAAEESVVSTEEEVSVEEETVSEKETTVATEALSEEGAQIGGLVIYAALAALASFLAKNKTSDGRESKYIEMLNKEAKPAIKMAKIQVKEGKRKKDYDKAIAGCRDMIKVHEKMIKEIDTLAKDVRVAKQKDSDGKITETFVTKFNTTAGIARDNAMEEIAKLKADIKIFEQKKRSKGFESAAENDAYMEGYLAAYEQFAVADLADVEEEEEVEEETTEE